MKPINTFVNGKRSPKKTFAASKIGINIMSQKIKNISKIFYKVNYKSEYVIYFIEQQTICQES